MWGVSVSSERGGWLRSISIIRCSKGIEKLVGRADEAVRSSLAIRILRRKFHIQCAVVVTVDEFVFYIDMC